MRNSLKQKRDGELFRFFKQEIVYLTDLANRGEIDLCYFAAAARMKQALI